MNRTEISPPPTSWGRLIALGAGLSLLVAVVLLAFSWPAVTADPQGLPVGVVGEPDQVDQVAENIEDQADGAIELTRLDDRAAAVDAIEQRKVYGAVILGAEPTEGPEILIARAANTQVAQMLSGFAPRLQSEIDAKIREQVETGIAQAQEQAAAQMQQALQAVAQGQTPQLAPTGDGEAFSIPTVTVEVTDVVPLSDDDPNGAGLTASMFPLVIGGILGGVFITLAVKGSGARRVVAVLIYAASAGLVLTGVLQGIYGALQGDYGLNALGMGLAIAAISGTITGLGAVLGRAGTAIGSAFMILVANPLSAATVPVEFILSPWGTFGQWLPAGSAATLMRDLSYFPDAETSFSWTVLSVWAVVGLALTFVTLRRKDPSKSGSQAG
ncbi:ABC transporter permease [Leucobacter tenebrionis]|uniref:ABC transporter permease n=1 Tax=Leucobacter tenebrionis TaxID=2873270 RepID=UPI001CA7515C|nr:ABC transporter permease [Leucobacter tenebrionis]QZY52400.1 hypothetical protein KVY00_02730 [Leucobacter tenebrionis]